MRRGRNCTPGRHAGSEWFHPSVRIEQLARRAPAMGWRLVEVSAYFEDVAAWGEGEVGAAGEEVGVLAAVDA